MLISFTIENFRSFSDEQELSLIANTRQANHTEHLVSVPGHDERILPVLAIYGANGSGKSNLVRALGWLRKSVFAPPRNLGESPSIRVQPFLFSASSRPSRLEIRFISQSMVLEYGATFSRARYESEWLSAISGNRERIVFERKTTSHETTVEYGDGIEARGPRLEALRLVGAQPTELFLSRLLRDCDASDLPAAVAATGEWLRRLQLISCDAEYRDLPARARDDADFRKYLESLLQRVDPTLRGVHVQRNEVTADELPDFRRKRFDEAALGDRLPGDPPLYKVDERTAEQLQLQLQHQGPEGLSLPLDFAEESDGTKRLAHIAPAAFSASAGNVVFVIDELDRSLHALLVRAFVAEFLDRAHGSSSQLIFTTHETHVLDQDLLRRDEVWFVEKTPKGDSRLYSLDDYPVRNDLRLDRSYLQGRFGAIPDIRPP